MTAPASITCPICRATSYHAGDIRHRYCGACRQFHEEMAEAALVEASARELLGVLQPLELGLQPQSAFTLGALLQLTLRHPALPPASGAFAGAALAAIREYFEHLHCAATLELLRRGDDPRRDRPPDPEPTPEA